MPNDKPRQRRALLENPAPRAVLAKAVTAALIAKHRGYGTADDVASEEWPRLHEVPVFLRAASSPATTASAPDLGAERGQGFLTRNSAGTPSSRLFNDFNKIDGQRIV